MLRRTLAPLLLLLVLAGVAVACPTCEVGIGDETVRTTLAGYEWSFVFLAACPFTIVGAVFFGAYRVLGGLAEDHSQAEPVMVPR